jgi:hypothetical protein
MAQTQADAIEFVARKPGWMLEARGIARLLDGGRNPGRTTHT